MFNSVTKTHEISFLSNSLVRDVPVVVPLEKDGSTVNHFEIRQDDLRSPLEGCHFDENIHSLRAKLNLGIKLSEVPNANIDDFDVAFNKINLFGTKLDAYIATRNEENQVSKESPASKDTSV